MNDICRKNYTGMGYIINYSKALLPSGSKEPVSRYLKELPDVTPVIRRRIRQDGFSNYMKMKKPAYTLLISNRSLVTKALIFLLLLQVLYLGSCRNQTGKVPGSQAGEPMVAETTYQGIPDSQLIRFRTPAFRQIKTARLIINLDPGNAQDIKLPLKEDVSRLLSYAGIRENDSAYNMTVRINLTAKALSYEYKTRNSGGITGTHYTAARIAAEIAFELPSGSRIVKNSEYRSSPPEVIYEEHLTPGTAPFAEIYSIPLAKAFYECCYSSLGILPVIVSAGTGQEKYFSEQADSFLLSLKDGKAVLPMIAALENQSADWTRVNRSLVVALGRQADTTAVAPLFRILKSSVEEDRIAAEKALDDIDPHWPASARAVGLLPSLYPALSDHDSSLRLFTVHIMGRVRNRESLWYLILLSTDRDLNVRTAAREVMRVDFPHWASFEEAVRSIAYLVPFCASSDAGIRQSVEETLSAVDTGWTSSPGAAAAVPGLIKTLKDGDREARGNAAEVLGRIHDQRAVKPLIALLADDSRYTRERAIKALGDLGDRSAVKPLISLAEKDPEAYLTEAVRDALMRLTGKDPGADHKSWSRLKREN
jgi:hypothetical protein